MVVEVGVKVEQSGLECWLWEDGGMLVKVDELKEEEEFEVFVIVGDVFVLGLMFFLYKE